jgi:xanthine dehydrogenase molybdenum-binding subunit
MTKMNTVGTRVRNKDALDKVTGGRHFPVNVKLPGMLHGKLVRSPYGHAKILNIDTSDALSLPGVKAVVTSADIPSVQFNPIYFMPAEALGANRDFEVLGDTVRYVGQPVAAVAATTPEIAERAAELIDVEYEELPAVYSIEQALEEGAQKIHEYSEGNLAKNPVFETGDVAEAFKNADHIFEQSYQTQRVNTCALEPRVCVCDYDQEGYITVHSSMQHLFGLREKLAYALQIPVSRVRVVKPRYIGGGFGGKLDLGHLEPLASMLSKKSGRPVRIVNSRADEFVTGNRNPITLELKTGVNKDGVMVARTARSTTDAGGYATHGSTVIMVHGLFGFMFTYNCPNRKWEGRTVHTNNVPSGGFRGYGAPQASFAVEQQIDEICHELELNPVEFRLKNCHLEGEQHPFFDGTFTTYRFDECLRKGAEAIDWNNRQAPGSNPGTKKRGIGLGCVPTWTSNCTAQPDLYEHSGAIVKLNPDGTADIACAAVDIGCGQNTVYCQIVAAELGIAFEDVRMSPGVDTSNVPFDAPMHASRGTHAVGNAVKAAAIDAKDHLLRIAATMLEASAEDLEVVDGQVQVKGSSHLSVSVSDVATRADSPLVVTTDKGPQPTSTPYRGTIIGSATMNPTFSPIPAGAMFVEVEVDTETGEVDVVKVVYAHDLGRVINPVGAEGQVEGAIQQGIGYALMEHTQFDPDNGNCLSGDFLDYKMPTAVEMPTEIECIFIESMEESGPFGAKSMSECCLIAPAGAIANAVFNATGARVRELPITPEKVLQAMG